MRHRRPLLPLSLVLVAALLAGCGGGGSPGGSGDDPIAALDPEALYRDYEEGGDEGGSAGAPNAMAAGGDVATESADGAGPGPGVAPPPEPGVDEDNTFTDAGTNPWTAPGDDALSTFGLDVDTGSWNVVRGFVAEGVAPPPEAVRTEELVNALGDVDPAPEDTLGVTVEGGEVGERLLVRLGVSAREVAAEDRPDVNLVFVVDTSGSMDIRDRLGLVKASLAVLAQNLRPTDTVSIVTFGDEARAYLPPTPISDGGTVASAIEDLGPGGSTNLEAGLRLGYETADGLLDDESLTRVVLLSDGVANVGETGPGSLVEQIRDEADRGVKLVTVGFGLGNFNDTLMEQVADRGDGFYAYVDTLDEARRLFAEELTTTLVTVAEDARAQVTFDPATVARYRLVGYENRAIADDEFAEPATDAGELGSGHRVVALYEVEPVAGPEGAEGADGPVALGSVELRWDEPTGGEERTVTVPVTVEVGAEAPTATRVAAAVADLAEVLRDPERTADGLAAVADRLDVLAAQVDDPVLADMAAVARQAVALV